MNNEYNEGKEYMFTKRAKRAMDTNEFRWKLGLIWIGNEVKYRLSWEFVSFWDCRGDTICCGFICGLILYVVVCRGEYCMWSDQRWEKCNF